MNIKSCRLLAASCVLLFALSASVCPAQETDEFSVSAEVRETADLISKAPLVLVLATAQHFLDHREWPHEYRDIDRMVNANARVLPKSFVFRKVRFSGQSRKECTIHFTFAWPTLEGGGAEGSIVLRSGRSLQAIAKTAAVSWAKPPKLRADLQPGEPAPPPADDAPAGR